MATALYGADLTRQALIWANSGVTSDRGSQLEHGTAFVVEDQQ